MRHFAPLVLSLLLPSTQPSIWGTAVSAAAILISQQPAKVQNAESVAKIAQAIMVGIEGVTQGSGVLVKRDGNHYTVLTAWHVVSDQGPGEELEIFIPDGQRHQLEQGSIKRVGEVDMAVISFTSSNTYKVASIGDVKKISMGSPIFVAGVPLITEAVNARILRFLKGDVIANATVAIANGYQLLYSNPTLPGMSGGAALNAQGQLVGIHGQGETDIQMSEQQDVAVKTGTNQTVPIIYYSKWLSGSLHVSSPAIPSSADDFLVEARTLAGKKGREQDVIRLSSKALEMIQSAEAYFIRAYARDDLGDSQGAIDDYSQAIRLNPQFVNAFLNRGKIRLRKTRDYTGAVEDYTKAMSTDLPSLVLIDAIGPRAQTNIYMQDIVGMCDDYRLQQSLIDSRPDLKALKNDRNVREGINKVLSFCPKS